MKYGYARISALIQLKGNSLEEQQQELIHAGVAKENIICEQYSGKTTARPKFETLLRKLAPGDELVCCKLDRFARNAEDGLRTVRQLSDRGIVVNILNIGRIDNSAVGKLTLTIMLAFAEFERSMILERTAAGKAVAKTKAGYREGRPPYKKAVIDNAMELLKTHTYKEVVEITGISRATLARYKQRYELRITAVTPRPNQILKVIFSNGETRWFDTKKLKGPAFVPLKDKAVFENPVIFHGIITWADGTIDVSPETVYMESQCDEASV